MNPEKWTDNDAEKAAAWLEHNRDPEMRAALDKYAEIKSERVRASLARPAEYIAPQPPGLSGFRALLPSYVGGTAEHLQEPSMEQFIRTLGGKVPDGFDVERGFKDYSDALWAQQYDKAKAEGRTVVRHSQMATPDFSSKVVKGIGDVQDAAIGDLGSFVHTATLGLDRPLIAGLGKAVGAVTGDPNTAKNFLDTEQSAIERSPVSGLTGLLGAFAPGALGGQISEAVTAARGAKPAASALGRIIGGGLTGAAVGTTGKAIENQTENLGNAIADINERKDASEGLGAAAKFGGALGTLGGLAGVLNKSLRSGATGADLRNLERAGGGTSILEGVKLPAAVEADLEAANESGRNPMDLASRRIRGEFADSVADTNAKRAAEFADRKSLYLDSKEGREAIAPEPLIDALMTVAKRERYSGRGDRLGFAPDEMSQALNRMVTVKVVPAIEAKGGAQYGPGAFAMTPAQAERIGLKFELPEAPAAAPEPAAPTGPTTRPLPADDLAKTGAGAPIAKGIAPMAAAAQQQAEKGFDKLQARLSDAAGRYSVVAIPKVMNAADVDHAQRLIDNAANIDKRGAIGKDEYALLMKAIRETRDRFKPNTFAPESLTATLDNGKQVKGWSALHTLESQAIDDTRRLLENAGVRPAPTEFGASDIEKQLGDSIRKYRQGEGRMDADLALEEIARGVPQGAKKLAQVTATKIGPKLQEKASIMKTLPLLGGGVNIGPLLKAAHFHADPVLQATEYLAPRAAGSVTIPNLQGHMGGDEYLKLLELARRLQADQQEQIQ